MNSLKGLTFFMGILVFLLVTPGESGEKKTPKIEKVALTTPQIHNMNVLPYELGIKEGFYKREGIELEYLLMKGTLSTVGLKTGEIDYVAIGSSAIIAAASGLPIKAVMVLRSKSGLVLVARPGINSVKELKGKVIGGGSYIGAMTDNAVRAMLRHHDLNPDKDVIIRQTAENIKTAVLLSGAVDAGIMNIMEGIRLEKKGFKSLMSAEDVMKGISGAITVSVKKLKENPFQIKKIIRGTLKTLAYIKENRKETIDFMVKEWGLERELAIPLYEREGEEGYNANGKAHDENFQTEIKQAQERGLLSSHLKVPIAQLRDYTLLEEVLKEMGIR